MAPHRKGFQYSTPTFLTRVQTTRLDLLIICVGRTGERRSQSLLRGVYRCVCDQASEVERRRDGLLAVSLIGVLDCLISGLEAWILHSTAHLMEGFNLSTHVC